MPRPARSDIGALLQEARGLEVLAAEADVAPDRLQDYWAFSADLITLVLDIEDFERSAPSSTYDDPGLLDLKRRMRALGARLTQLSESA